VPTGVGAAADRASDLARGGELCWHRAVTAVEDSAWEALAAEAMAGIKEHEDMRQRRGSDVGVELDTDSAPYGSLDPARVVDVFGGDADLADHEGEAINEVLARHAGACWPCFCFWPAPVTYRECRAVIIKGVYKSYGALGGGGSLMDSHEFWRFVKDARLTSQTLRLSMLW